MPGTVFSFGEFTLDCGRFELRRNDISLKLERKPLELLILLASRQGQLVTRTEIAERLWDSEVFVDTEHGINTAIRKIRQALRDDSEEPRFVQTATGMGYRFVAAVTVAEAPVSSVTEPTVPATPSPLAHSPAAEPPATNPAPLLSSSRRAVWFPVAAFLLIVVAALALTLGPNSLATHFLRRSSAPAITSLAVLPLDNLSGDPGQEYLADGMTDELTTMVARNSTLRVTSRTSVMQYKGVHRPLSEIARALGVDGIVEGSIARKGSHVHMTLQLIRADTDAHIWAESFDRDAGETALAEEAAREIAKQLHSVRPAATSSRYINPEAHDAYLKGKYLWFSDNMLDSGPYYRKATEIQPDYAAAWAGLANYYGESVAYDQLDPRIALPKEEEAAKHALALEPDLAEAHSAMAAAYLIARWDWTNADIESRRALSLDPNNAELLYFQACVFSAMNRKAEAIEFARKSVEIAPYQRPGALAGMYLYDRQYAAALAEVRLRLQALPNNLGLLLTEYEIWRRQGDYKEAVDAWARAQIAAGNPSLAERARQAYRQGGAHEFLRWLLHQREMDAKKGYISPVELASYHAQLGEKNPTLALLEEGSRQRATDMRWIRYDPAFDFLNNDLQYRSILQRVGEPPVP